MQKPWSKNKKAADAIKRMGLDLPSLTIARRLYNEDPKYWGSIELARSIVRCVRGAQGQKNNPNGCIRPDVAREFGSQSDRPPLPKSHQVTREPYVIGSGRVAILSDHHFPYHDTEAVTVAHEAISEFDPDVIFLNGDIWDCAEVSRHDRDRSARPLVEERESVTGYLDWVRYMHPRARIVYKVGNHEERIDAYVLSKADAFKDLPELSIGGLLGLEERGIDLVQDKRIVMLGKLPVLHGHEHRAGFTAPVNPARGLYLRTHESAAIGHHHRTSEHSEQSLSGSIEVTWSIGCLCGLSPNYAPFNQWNHGFALVEVASDGSYLMHNKKIIRGVVR